MRASSISNDSVNVTTSSTQVLPARSRRLYAVLVNISSADIDIALGADAVVGKGARLYAYGGAYVIDENNAWDGVINAIHAGTGNKVLAYIEGYAT